eukprot:g11064.t1
MLLVKKQPREVRNAVKTMAAQLRLGIVVEGLRNIEVYLDRQYAFYGTWYNYVEQVVFDLKRCGWVVEEMPEDRWRMASRDSARLVFLGCLHHIALTNVQNVNGGEWQWTLFQPLVAPDPGRQTVHVVMTYVSSAEYRPQFMDAHEYKRLNGGRIRELNHFVALSHDNTAKNHEAAVTRMVGLVRSAQDACNESEARLKEAVGDSGGSPSAQNTCADLADAQGKAQEQLRRRQAAYRYPAGFRGGGNRVGVGAAGGSLGPRTKRGDSLRVKRLRLLMRSAAGWGKARTGVQRQRGDMGVGIGTRFHTGSWEGSGGRYGTILKVNLDDEFWTASYDVHMDGETTETTFPAKQVEDAVWYARRLQQRAPSGGGEKDSTHAGGGSTEGKQSNAGDASGPNARPVVDGTTNNERNSERDEGSVKEVVGMVAATTNGSMGGRGSGQKQMMGQAEVGGVEGADGRRNAVTNPVSGESKRKRRSVGPREQSGAGDGTGEGGGGRGPDWEDDQDKEEEKEDDPGKDPGSGDDENNEKEDIWEPGDPDGVVAVGREFDVDAAMPRDTWDKVSDVCLRGLESAGHKTIKTKRRVTLKTDQSRHVYCEIICKHNGSPRFKEYVPTAGKKNRERRSQKMGCPFKVGIYWRSGTLTPVVTQVWNFMAKVQEELYCFPEDAANFFATLRSDPGMYECPHLLFVGIDDENRSCILGQGLLRSECAEAFEWFLNHYKSAAGGWERRPKVILTDADVAMTSAVASVWKGTQHLFCLWHVNKNIVKKCAGALSDDDRTRMLRSFRSAAYDAVNAEAFASSSGQIEQISAGMKCDGYVDNLFKLATPAIAAQLPFQEKHMENFFTPVNEGLQSVGASQFCTRVFNSNGGNEVRIPFADVTATDCLRLMIAEATTESATKARAKHALDDMDLLPGESWPSAIQRMARIFRAANVQADRPALSEETYFWRKAPTAGNAPSPDDPKSIMDKYIMAQRVCFSHARGTICNSMTTKGRCPFSHAEDVIPFRSYPDPDPKATQAALAAINVTDENDLYAASLLVVFPLKPFDPEQGADMGVVRGVQWWTPGTLPRFKLTNRTTTTKAAKAEVQVATAYATNCDDVERMLLLKEPAPPEVPSDPPPWRPTTAAPASGTQGDCIRVSEINTGPLSVGVRATLLKIVSAQLDKGLFPANDKTLTTVHGREMEIPLIDENVTHIACKHQRHNPVHADIINMQVDKWKEMGIVEYSDSHREQGLRRKWLDDILIHTETLEERFQMLEEVLDLLQTDNYSVHFHKSLFCKAKVEFLGVVVGRSGVRPPLSKITELTEMEKPTTVGALQSVIGMTNFMRDFVEGFSAKIAPLWDILRNKDFSTKHARNKPIPWGKAKDDAFDAITRALVPPPVLLPPDWNLPFTLHTDASEIAAGAALTQEVEHRDAVIGYGSKRWTPAEARHAPTIREVRGVLFGLDHFRTYLLHRPFTLVVDCSAITWLFTSQHLSSTMYSDAKDMVRTTMTGAESAMGTGPSNLKASLEHVTMKAGQPWGVLQVDISDMKDDARNEAEANPHRLFEDNRVDWLTTFARAECDEGLRQEVEVVLVGGMLGPDPESRPLTAHWFMGPCGNSGWEGASSPSTDQATRDGSSESKQDRAEGVRPILDLTREVCDWYASHYCEENTVRLCAHLLDRAEAADVELFIVFVSNQARQVPVWNQRLADNQDEPVLWDYHVLLLAKHPHGNWVYDLDSTLAFPTQAAQYMTQAFRRGERMEERFRQKFRVVSGRECVDHFSSDRSHMIQRGGAYSAEPPRLNPLRGPRSSSDHNIDEWISMDEDTGRGRVMSLLEMEAFINSGVPLKNEFPRAQLSSKAVEMKDTAGCVRRAFAAHQNSWEAMILWVSAVLTAKVMGVAEEDMNWSACGFLLARTVYIPAYTFIGTHATSFFRTATFTVGMFVSFRLLIKACQQA